MADPRLKALQKLAGVTDQSPVDKLAKIKAERSFGSKLMDYLNRPGAASRAAIMEGLKGGSALGAFGRQFVSPSDEAPSGQDIAEFVSEKYDIENPYALAGIETAAEFTDPTMLMPGGVLKKAPAAMKAVKDAPKAIKTNRALSKVGDVSFPAKNAAEAIAVERALKQVGRVPESSILQVGDKSVDVYNPLAKRSEMKVKKAVDEKELEDIMAQFPNVDPEKLAILKKK